MSRTGRPESLDYKKILTQYEQYGALGLHFKDIADIFNVRPETISRYNRVHPELIKAYNRGKARSTSGIKKAAVSKALKGDTVMIKYCLRNLSDWCEDPLVDNSKHTHITKVTIERYDPSIERKREGLSASSETR